MTAGFCKDFFFMVGIWNDFSFFRKTIVDPTAAIPATMKTAQPTTSLAIPTRIFQIHPLGCGINFSGKSPAAATIMKAM